MGFLSMLKKIKRKEKEIRILILGLDNAGKTTVVKKLCGEPIDTIEPTLGFQILTLAHTKTGLRLNLWDVGGQRSIRSYWRNYFESTDGILWVIDSIDVHRLELCRNELSDILQQERLLGASLLILANKQDVPGAASVESIRQALQLNEQTNPQLANRHWSILPCSAFTGSGLVEGLDWIVDDIAGRIFLLG